MATSSGHGTPRPGDRGTLTQCRYDDALARLNGPHAVGKPCPRKPWMLVTTLDRDKGVCGACGEAVKP